MITEQGEVGSVTDYLLKMEADGASNALMNGFIQATSLLLDYMEANKGLFEDPKMLFQTFAGNDSNLMIVFYVQIMPDDLVMQLHRF